MLQKKKQKKTECPLRQEHCHVLTFNVFPLRYSVHVFARLSCISRLSLTHTRSYETGVPHGYVPDGDKYAGDEKITITVKSLLHDDSEYGEKVR